MSRTGCSDYREILKECWPTIRKKLDALDILPYLATELSTAECQRIECDYNNNGPHSGADRLHACLERRAEECFIKFIIILEKMKPTYNSLVDLLKTKLTTHDLTLIKNGTKNETVEPALHLQQCHSHETESEMSESKQKTKKNPDKLPEVLHQHPSIRSGNPPADEAAESTVVAGQRRAPTKHETTESHDHNDSIGDLQSQVFDNLSEELIKEIPDDSGCAVPSWRRLINSFGLKRKECREIMTVRDKNPAEALLDHLDAAGYTVSALIEQLEKLKLNSAVNILRRDENNEFSNSPRNSIPPSHGDRNPPEQLNMELTRDENFGYNLDLPQNSEYKSDDGKNISLLQKKSNLNPPDVGTCLAMDESTFGMQSANNIGIENPCSDTSLSRAGSGNYVQGKQNQLSSSSIRRNPNEIPESHRSELSLESKSSLTPSEPAIAITRDRSRTDINKMLMESHGVPNSPKQQLTSAEQASNDTHGNQATANDDIEAANLHSDKIRQARIDSNYYAQGKESPNEIPESPGKELSSLEFKSSLTPSEPAIAVTRNQSHTNPNESDGVPNFPKGEPTARVTTAEQASNDTHGNQSFPNFNQETDSSLNSLKREPIHTVPSSKGSYFLEQASGDPYGNLAAANDNLECAKLHSDADEQFYIDNSFRNIQRQSPALDASTGDEAGNRSYSTSSENTSMENNCVSPEKIENNDQNRENP